MVMKKSGRRGHHMYAEREDMEQMDGYSMGWCFHHHHHWMRRLIRDVIVIVIAVCLSLMLAKREQWHWHVNKFDWLYHHDQKTEKPAQPQPGQPAQYR